MIKIELPNKSTPELEYILDIIFSEFYCLEYSCLISSELSNSVRFWNEFQSNFIELDISFLIEIDSNWGGAFNVSEIKKFSPSELGFVCDLVEDDLPLLFGTGQVNRIEKNITCDVDILGTVFFMLSRYEELVSNDLDKLERFSAKSSLAFKYQFLERPIVDEYLEFFRVLLSEISVFPKINLNGRVHTTCDVDWPVDYALRSFKSLLKDSLVKAVIEKNRLVIIKKLFNYCKRRLNLDFSDSYYENVYRIMDENEKLNNTVVFYFIPYQTSNLDSNVDYESETIKSLLSDIISRGHKIGVHPGFNTFNNRVEMEKTISKFLSIRKDIAPIDFDLFSRQHFLRWSSRSTPLLLEDAGVSEDSTLAYADYSGFRCGTSNKFSMYDLVNRCQLNIKQKPLIVMESTIISKRYEAFGYTQEGIDKMLLLKSRSMKYGGDFTLLWHNSHFYNKSDWDFYLKVID